SIIHGGPGALQNDGEDEINGLLGLSDDFTPVQPEPPTIAIASPADGSSLAPGRILVSGHAEADRIAVSAGRTQNRITLVSVNGRPVDVLDGAGNFFAYVDVGPGVNTLAFTATDAYSQTATAALKLTGVQTPASQIDFSLFSDVSGSLTAEYGRTS